MLTQAVETYLAVRRAAGFALRCEGFQLNSFAAFSEARKQRYVSTETAIAWAGLARSVPQRARRLGTVIRFARYLRAEDQHHEVPPAVFGAETSTRPTPYILREKQIRQLVAASSQSRYRICGTTYSTLFALLACTGLRVSEAIHLRLDDITPDGLVIRRTKFARAASCPCMRRLKRDSRGISGNGAPFLPSTTMCSCQCEENRSQCSLWIRHSARR